MISLDSQILPMKWKIVQAKIRAIAKTMGKPSDNLYKRALIKGRNTCNGEDLLTECMDWCRRWNVRCVKQGKYSALEKCKLKQTIWRENNEEIREALSSSEKVRNTRIPRTEKERNYLKRMNLPDARTWFRFRCKITKHIKGNMSSMYIERTWPADIAAQEKKKLRSIWLTCPTSPLPL